MGLESQPLTLSYADTGSKLSSWATRSSDFRYRLDYLSFVVAVLDQEVWILHHGLGDGLLAIAHPP